MPGLGECWWIEHSRDKEQVWKGPEVVGSKVYSWNEESAVWMETSRPPFKPSALGLRVASLEAPISQNILISMTLLFFSAIIFFG